MKRQYKKILYALGFMSLIFILVACSNDPIEIGQTNPKGIIEMIVVYPISWLITTIFAATGNGGVAIAAATILISIIVSPLEIKSQVETRKQQEIQPEIKDLAEKFPNHKTDKVEQQKYIKEQQRIYAEHGLSMAGMCLPLLLIALIQTPIMIGMFSAVRRLSVLNNSTFSLFGNTYSYGAIDPGLPAIPFIGPYIKVFIIAAVIMIFVSAFYTLPKGSRDPRGNQQAMQMYLINSIFIFIIWAQPIALAIYWIISNFARMILRLTIVNHLVEKEHQKFKEKQRIEKAKRYK